MQIIYIVNTVMVFGGEVERGGGIVFDCCAITGFDQPERRSQLRPKEY